MDKNTLSNYGWIVIAVLVLAVMIALATPFGTYIEQGVRSTTQGLFDTSEKAMNTALVDLGVQVDTPEFEESYKGVGGSDNSQTPQPKPELTTLTAKTWYDKDGNKFNFTGAIWTDNTNIYCGDNYILNGDTWEPKTWNNTPPNFDGHMIWTDGTNTYYSYNSRQYILNGDTWEPKTWNITNFNGNSIWTDGTNTYYSTATKQYVLNGDTWEPKTWNGLTNPTAGSVWTDGTNTYYSNFTSFLGTVGHFILNGDTWEPKTWNGLAEFKGNSIWTDGTNVYCGTRHILNGDTWEPKTWYDENGNEFIKTWYDENGNTRSTTFDVTSIWTDGINLFCTGDDSYHIFYYVIH